MAQPAREFRRIGPHYGTIAVETPRAAGGTYYLTAALGDGASEQAIAAAFELLESNLAAEIDEQETT